MTDVAQPRRIIDVSSPGESAPNASSRPIIVSHKPSVQDPMVGNPGIPTDENTAEKVPISHPILQAQSQIPPEPEAPEPSQLPTQAPQVQPAENNPSPSHIKQLVHDRTYFMPVTQRPRSRGVFWVFALLIGIFAVALYIFLAI